MRGIAIIKMACAAFDRQSTRSFDSASSTGLETSLRTESVVVASNVVRVRVVSRALQRVKRDRQHIIVRFVHRVEKETVGSVIFKTSTRVIFL
jgi:hypothetical protein